MVDKKDNSLFNGLSGEEITKAMQSAVGVRFDSLKIVVVFIQPEEQRKEKGYVVRWDLQPRDVTNGDYLLQNIREIGLEQSPVFVLRGDDRVLCKGHNRMDALYKFSTQYPEEYKAMFPNGVPCTLVTGTVTNGVESPVTEKLEMALRADHDGDSFRRQLTSKMEAIRLTKPLFLKQWTSLEVLKHTWRTVSRIFSGENAFRTLVDKVDKMTDDAERWRTIETALHGSYQFLKRMAEAPVSLLEYYQKDIKGEAPTHLTQKDYEKLSLIAKSEVEADRSINNLKPVGLSAEKTGPEFEAAFKKAKETTPAEKKVSAPAMKHSEIDTFRATFKSKFADVIFKSVLGNAAAKPIAEQMDGMIARIEVAADKDFTLLDTFVSRLSQGVTDTEKTALLSLLESFAVNPHVDVAKEIAADTATAKVEEPKASTPAGKAKPKK